jgi:hypothetical protein
MIAVFRLTASRTGMLENWARSEALALYWNDEAGLCQYVAKSCFSLVHLYKWPEARAQGSGVSRLVQRFNVQRFRG